MQSNRQFFGRALLACAASAPLAPVHAQTMPCAPPDMAEMHAMGGMGGMMGPHSMGHHDMGFMQGLDLDEAQSDQAFMIMHDQAPQARAVEKARARAGRDLDNLARSGQYSDAAAKPMVDAIAKSAADTALLHARAQSRIMALLRPDQRARVIRPTRATIRPTPDNAAPR